MDKKTTTTVVIVAAVVVVAGGLYGVNRWRQQQLAKQILKGVYGVDAGLLSGLTPGGNLQEQIAKELVKQGAQEEAKQKADEAKEAAKTPEDRYNETKEMPTYDANSKAIVAEAKAIVEKVFGKAKLTSISTGIYGAEFSGSGIMEFKIARLTTGDDLGALNKILTDMGLPIIQSGIDNKTAGVMAGTNEAAYTFSFEMDQQVVGVNIMKTSK